MVWVGKEREKKWVSPGDPRGKPEDGGETPTWGQWRLFSQKNQDWRIRVPLTLGFLIEYMLSGWYVSDLIMGAGNTVVDRTDLSVPP